MNIWCVELITIEIIHADLQNLKILNKKNTNPNYS